MMQLGGSKFKAVGLTSQSYATAPMELADDTGYDEVLVTIKKDETDKLLSIL